MLMAVHLKSKNVYALFFALLISNFVAGINLDDDLRGAKSSALAFRAKVMSQPVTFDLLKGSLLAESEKRKQKMAFARQVVKQLYSMHQPALIIAGYWINEIEVLSNHQLNNQIRLVYFSSENELKYYRLNAVACYYLPQQDVVNDLKYNHAFTAHYAKPLFEDNGNDFRY